MDKANRTRKHNVCIRMNDAEYESFQKKLEETGQTKQDFILDAINGATIAPPETEEELQQLNAKLVEASNLFRGAATNLNQVARNTNLLIAVLKDAHPDIVKVNALIGSLPDPNFIEQLAQYTLTYRKEVEEIWRSLRLSANLRKLTRVSETSSSTSSETTR